MVKNPPANAGDMGLIPGLGGVHMPQSNQTCGPEILSPGLKSVLPNRMSHCSEKPAHCH